MINGRCLCGAHHFQLEGALELMHHCHCGFCRKTHGTAFATPIGVARDRLHWERAEVIAYESSPGTLREACATCGTPLPAFFDGMPAFVPAGCLTDAIAERPLFHIFVASKAPWYEIRDELPRFDAFPPGLDSPVAETIVPRDPPGGVRGSCLCGDVRYVIEGAALRARHCHCSRCRLARGAAHASNLVVPVDALRFTAGLDRMRDYRVPEAKHFAQSFCGRCASKLPRVSPEREIAVVPLGGLDDPPPLVPQEHIWVADKPEWSEIFDALPQLPGAPA